MFFETWKPKEHAVFWTKQGLPLEKLKKHQN